MPSRGLPAWRQHDSLMGDSGHCGAPPPSPQPAPSGLASQHCQRAALASDGSRGHRATPARR
eukprot:6591662-Alexandrium_andersonii.AAC.1